MDRRLHIVIDESLDPIYGCVQGAHCAVEYTLQQKDWNNEYLIFLKGDIDKIIAKLINRNIKYIPFMEPDLNNKITAIAILDNSKFFKKFSLIK